MLTTIALSLTIAPAQASCASVQTGESYVKAANNVTFGDFDGDTIVDYVYGDPSAADRCEEEGTVFVRYGSDIDAEVELRATSTCNAKRGGAVAAGDLNGDGYDDLAIGSPGVDRVQVRYGGPSGLGSVSVRLNLDVAFGSDTTFGSALTLGDYNGDGYEDVAVGAPLADVDDARDAGVVAVFYGSTRGPDSPPTVIDAGSFGLDTSEAGAFFGSVLVADTALTARHSVLAVAVPGKDVGAADDAGVVHVLSGGDRGVGDGGVYTIKGDSRDLRLGIGMAMGDADADGELDLALPRAGMWKLGSAGATFDSSTLELVLKEGIPVDPSAGPTVYADDFIVNGEGCEPCCGPEYCCL